MLKSYPVRIRGRRRQPEPYLCTEVSDRLIQLILDASTHEGLTSEQVRQVLDRFARRIDLK